MGILGVAGSMELGIWLIATWTPYTASSSMTNFRGYDITHLHHHFFEILGFLDDRLSGLFVYLCSFDERSFGIYVAKKVLAL